MILRHYFTRSVNPTVILSRSTPSLPRISKVTSSGGCWHKDIHEMKYLSNLNNYKPHFYNNSKNSVWHRVPANRRCSVMVLLFQGDSGELRVILTKRSRQLKSFSGHVSLPGGKVDFGLESEFECARREMEEEIGISKDDDYLWENFGYRVTQLTTLPTYLARTFLAVSPCVGFVQWKEGVERHIGTVLNPGESSSIFSVPLKDFLRGEMKECLKQSFIKTKWGGLPWNLRSFIFPVSNDNEVSWLREVEDLSSEDETHDDHEMGFRTRNCWGLTANILHDVAQIVYGGNSQILGEEDLIFTLWNNGQIQSKERSEFEKKLFNNTKGCSFGEVMSKEEFNSLKNLYN